MLWSWNENYCYWPPHGWIQFPFGVELPQIYVCITVSHIFAGTGTCPCFREYFSLGGCTGPGIYNIFIYCTTVIVIREYFTLGGCLGVRMSNAICGGVVTTLGLEFVIPQCQGHKATVYHEPFPTIGAL